MTPGPFPSCNSGYLLGRLVDAFSLRAFDAAEAFSGKGARNASRYFSGERVDPKARDLLLHGIAVALDRSNLLPRLFDAGAVLPALPQEVVQETSVDRGALVEVMLRNFARNWDETEGALKRLSAAVAFPGSAKGATARLLAVDLALRTAGILWLARSERCEPLPMHWAEDNGVGVLLRERLAECSPRVTRAHLAERLMVSQNAVASWLDQDVRPSDENLQDLGELLGTGGGRHVSDMVRELRLLYGSRELYRLLEDAIGTTEARAVAQVLCGLPLFFLQFPRRSRSPEGNDIKMGAAALFGATAPPPMSEGRRRKRCGFQDAVEILELADTPAVRPVLQAMLREATNVAPDPVWATTLRGAASSWFDHLQWVARRLAPLSGEELATMKAMVLDHPLEAAAYMAQAPFESSMSTSIQQASEEIARGFGHPSLYARVRGDERVARNDLRGAADEFRRAVALDFEDKEAHFRLGGVLWQLGEFAEARAELHLALAQEPSWDRPRVELAVIELNLGQYSAALGILENATRQVIPKSPWVQLHLAYAYEMLGESAEAIAAYRELVDLDPSNGEGHDRLAHLLLASGKKREGARCARQAHHLGFADVYLAWKAAYYNGADVTKRPPRCTPDGLRQLD